ncbi:TIGR03862 family flavoprotein [Celeribacter arenosi]|uniref:TIGR03862 family flavoprotein n=1 Tax=Celeribacter arenosi TaxID=792649 RepID=A0ABP7JY42_9RHOB
MTPAHEAIDALIIGAGPAGLMAAEMLASRGHGVVVCDAKPSVARKFLMAGKSGLNLTKNEPLDEFLRAFDPCPPALEHALGEFGPSQTIEWAEGLGQEMFTGSSGRVFPKAMKASPLLRAWLTRLDATGVEIRAKWRLVGLTDHAEFDTPQGPRTVAAKATILALGGASWARLGSDGRWTALLSSACDLTPFAPANAALDIAWSDHMTRHFGTPVKGIALSAGRFQSRGECVVSSRGLEGGGIYSVSRGVREGLPLHIDLLPDWTEERVHTVMGSRKRKETLSSFLRRAFRLPPAKIALVMEYGRKAPDIGSVLKSLEISPLTLRPMDEAISTAGGVAFSAITEDFELKAMPGVYVAGEMLDWEAPTGGYLITACLATGRAAGLAASRALTASRAG